MLENNVKKNPEDDSEEGDSGVVFDGEMVDIYVPMDRGYAWIILAACLALMITVNGSGRAFGIFFVELLKEFDASSSTISFVLGVQSFSYSLSVFFVLNCLAEFMTHRALVLIGAVFCTVTFVLDSISPSVELLILAHFIHGMGIAFVFGPSVVIVGHYFEKYRGSANAIASCGSSIGQFCLSPLFTFLISHYGIRGSLLLQAGLMLHCLVFASLLRPTDFFRKLALLKSRLLSASCSAKDLTSENFSSNNSISFIAPKTVSTSNVKTNHQNNNTLTEGEKKVGKMISCPKQILSPGATISILELSNSNPEGLPMLHAKEGVDIIGKLAKSCDLAHLAEQEPSHSPNTLHFVSDSMLGLGSMVSLQDISRRSSQVKAMLYLRKSSLIGLPCLEQEADALRASRIDNKFRKLAKQIFSRIDLHLLHYKLYLVFLFGYNFGCCGSSVMHNYFPSHARDIGLTREQGTFILSLSGISDLVGRISMSILADRLCIQRSLLISIILLTNGAACCCVPLMDTFNWFAAYCVLYGISGGLFFSCITSVLTDFIGLKSLSKGLSVGFLFQGISASFAFPLHGFLRDTFGSYTTGFLLNGVSLATSAVLFFLAPYARKLDLKAQKEGAKAESKVNKI